MNFEHIAAAQVEALGLEWTGEITPWDCLWLAEIGVKWESKPSARSSNTVSVNSRSAIGLSDVGL